ncbi:hypothetical protein [Natrinema sp. 1APR25-10V2]|uniref:hypothetical protein n=1 Tax=Natrinema sp. 1APR25-10V2 TaxID=2951081 RepID=UPI002875F732|nr:hypothetical protein [Natrinema sp. 1APR25-10V2]MDS0476863.1 hypothetical protein [Natrinema sp. 1APR25-10V2]
MEFRAWLRCPACGADGVDDVSILAHETAIVLECYDCGAIREFEIGEDVPVHDLNPPEIEATEKADND